MYISCKFTDKNARFEKCKTFFLFSEGLLEIRKLTISHSHATIVLHADKARPADMHTKMKQLATLSMLILGTFDYDELMGSRMYSLCGFLTPP